MVGASLSLPDVQVKPVKPVGRTGTGIPARSACPSFPHESLAGGRRMPCQCPVAGPGLRARKKAA